MDEDTDSANWVLVDEIDCAEEAITLNPLITSVPAPPDSDQESDGSISIISDHHTDSYSEEETETPKKNDDIPKIMPIIKIDTEFETDVNDDDDDIEDQVQQHESVEPSEKTDDVQEPATENNTTPTQDILKLPTEDVEKASSEFIQGSSAEDLQESASNHQTSDDDIPSTSTSESSTSKQWTFADGKSKLELDMPKKTFFLDCSQEPILEVSANDTDVETESTSSTLETQTVIREDDTPVTDISSRDLARERDGYINRVSVGFMISMLILTSSHLLSQYLDCSEDIIYPLNPSTSFLDSIAENEKAKPIVDFCINQQIAKGIEYSEHAAEKCVIKRLKKKNREDAMKKTEIYLQMKERVLELREKELAEKEREILKKWRKRMYKDDGVEEEKQRIKYDRSHKENTFKSSKEFNKKFNKHFEHREGKSGENYEENFPEKKDKVWKNDVKNKFKTFRKKGSWVFGSAKEATDWNYKTFSKDDIISNKKFKKNNKNKEEKLRSIKDQVSEFQKDKSKQKYKDLKDDKKEIPNEEWYIKYNPVKNTIELINITTLPEQDSELIRNGNKTINGQWYFSLYGSGRSNIRNKEKAAEWYFRRGNFRENKRDKAKWYFDYMSARDNTRYFY